MDLPRPLLLLLALAGGVALPALPTPHPDRPDRLLETRDGLTVEYSPGQEAWMERAFLQMQEEAGADAGPPASTPVPVRRPGPAIPGSAQFLQENRDVILATVARHTGLPKATVLQGRVFDTFLGYYKLTSELMHDFGRNLPATLTPKRLAIWQRDDLVARLRAGARIEGMSYDPATDSGQFSFKFDLDAGSLGARLREIQAEIDAQKIKHQFNYGEGNYSATVSLGKTPEARQKPRDQAPKPPDDLAAVLAHLVMPVIYLGAVTTPPTAEDFNYLPQQLAEARALLARQAADYRDANMMLIILHETAEAGLVEKIIASRDRRWLCDGTANYVAWRVTRDLAGPDFAQKAYNLDAQLRRHAAHQPKIDLTAWSAVEHQKKGEPETELNRAHYTFATRAMFLLAEKHGDDALALLWTDVAKTPRKKVTAKTFAEAYRKRFKADLGQLIAEARQKPIPAAVVPATAPPKS